MHVLFAVHVAANSAHNLSYMIILCNHRVIYLIICTHLEYVIALGVQYHNALIEVVMLHCAGRVQNGQRTGGFRLKRIVGAAMIEIVAETCHKQAKYFQVSHKSLHFAGFHHGEHRLGDIQGVSPIVVFHWTVIFLHAENPTTEHLPHNIRSVVIVNSC